MTLTKEGSTQSSELVLSAIATHENPTGNVVPATLTVSLADFTGNPRSVIYDRTKPQW